MDPSKIEQSELHTFLLANIDPTEAGRPTTNWAKAVLLTPTENRTVSAGRVLGLVATLHQNLECEQYGTTGT